MIEKEAVYVMRYDIPIADWGGAVISKTSLLQPTIGHVYIV
jgi:hypothetical protein